MALEDTLVSWTKPSSDTEKDKQERTERMIREAVANHEAFNNCSLSVYGKGSYANNTNVRIDSDVDVAVECTDLFYWKEAEPGSKPPGQSYEGGWTPEKLRAELVAALEKKFPGQVTSSGRVAIEVHSSSARVDADVVPCFSYRFYFKSGNYRSGTKIFPTKGSPFVNYPSQHLENGTAKNKRTGHRFKKTVRILKRVANAMENEGVHEEVPSYFVECLVYNCNDDVFSETTWTSITKRTLFQIWEALEGEEPTDSDERWMEVDGCFFLFHPDQKWTRADGRAFAKKAWNYLELGNE